MSLKMTIICTCPYLQRHATCKSVQPQYEKGSLFLLFSRGPQPCRYYSFNPGIHISSEITPMKVNAISVGFRLNQKPHRSVPVSAGWMLVSTDFYSGTKCHLVRICPLDSWTVWELIKYHNVRQG